MQDSGSLRTIQRPKALRATLSGRRLRRLRETLTAYLMLSPALILILLFGIFPVLFAVFVSVHKWRLVRTDYLGIQNYVTAIGNAAYVVLFFIGLGALIGGVLSLRQLIRDIQEDDPRAYGLALPGLAHAAAIAAFVRYIWLQLPEFLDIGEKLRGQEKTRELFRQLLSEAFHAPTVQPAWRQFVLILLLAIALGTAAVLLYRSRKNVNTQARFMVFWLALSAGIGILYFTYTQIAAAYTAALETGTDPGIWPQFITITAGVLLLVAGWFVWDSASGQASNWQFWGRIVAAIALLVGGWLLIGEIPTIIAQGDKDLWEGLKVTIYFSLGTVPFQLAFAMLLAILLFQKLRGSAWFRTIFFIPYVTPFVASAAIFRQLFANRDTSPINLIIRGLGGQALGWLQESAGIGELLGNSLGITVPTWLIGPSLALVVVIIHSIWTYVGYDTVIYLAGLANIPGELNEAAAIDGANQWEIFRHVTFPLLSPTTYFLSLIAIIGTFKAFATLWVFRESLALGTTDTFSVAIFVEFFEKLRYGYASAMAFVLFLIILALTVINNRVQGSRVFYG
jgi:ABC-type sugar transport system permease subunit